MCMTLPPAAEMIFGLMVLNIDLLDAFPAARRMTTFSEKCSATFSSLLKQSKRPVGLLRRDE